eukprot:scaffold1376_cov257-Pinguiococcus_pyrenoidosus.AAC.22
MAQEEVVSQKEYVVVEQSRGSFSIVRIEKGRNFRLGNRNFPCWKLLGVRYGSVLQVDPKGKLQPLEGVRDLDEVAMPAILPQKTGDVDEGGNAAFQDTNTAQRLTEDEIAKMREQGVGSAAIIQALAENSATFAQKTEFSKEKWLKRKQQKYAPRLRVHRTNAMTLCGVYFEKNNEKVSNLRSDALAQVLAYGNVCSGQQILLIDTCMGLVTGAIMERLGGDGCIFHAYTGQAANLDAVQRFNFSPDVMDTLVTLPLSLLVSMSKSLREESDGTAKKTGDADEEDKKDDEENAAAAAAAAAAQEEENAAEEEKPQKLVNGHSTLESLLNEIPDGFKTRLEDLSPEEANAAIERRKVRLEKLWNRPTLAEIEFHLRRYFVDSLVIAGRVNPSQAFWAAEPFLKPAGTVVIFCEVLEPLVELQEEIRNHGCCTCLQISSAWSRAYQVLPKRTHPEMHMNADGGYVFSAVKLLEPNPPKSVDSKRRAENGDEVDDKDADPQAEGAEAGDDEKPARKKRRTSET